MGKHLIANQCVPCLLEKSPSRRAGFLERYLPVFLFFTLANCILQIACQIVRITLCLVELAFGLQLLVARDLASGVLNRALGLVRGSLNVFAVCGIDVLMYQQRTGASGSSIKRKNAASGGTQKCRERRNNVRYQKPRLRPQ